MDLRSVSKSLGTRLAVPSTIMTPQLEDYDLIKHFRDNKVFKDDGSVQLVFNLACVKDDELVLTSPKENVLKVQVVHSRRDMGGVVFARDCVYTFTLPKEVTKYPLTAYRTLDNYLIVVQSSTATDIAKDKGSMDVGSCEESKLVETGKFVNQLEARKVNLFLKPCLDQTILRKAIEHAEIGLFHTKRIVQNCSFVFFNEKKLADAMVIKDVTDSVCEFTLDPTKEGKQDGSKKDSSTHPLTGKKRALLETNTNDSGPLKKQIKV